ncbi:thiol:disulfide interchange protein [Parvularcula sp. ZS-1/3]|uniref:Thiol:disulfide interchange protein n=1 Tax=Parvularcula mediterranea TaxID=2732508 RepID=A0A7Y3RMV9_9PROT|nr:thioredoxin family protein [Parvularcula mediterranea]NNU16915.1 thiol:disulfide interchange protein [Parvularcula mediterranea]
MLRFLFALAAFLTAAHAQTGEAVRTGHAESRLIAETTAAVPGETLWVALAQELEEGWHVYWKNPGDSGLPLSLGWTLPEGWEAGEIGYPIPHRLPLGPLTNFGHEGSPTFLVPITVPEGFATGESVTLDVFAEWLICLDVCIPESANLSLTIPVAETAQPVPGNAERIRAAKSAAPKDLGLEARFADTDGSITLRIEGAPAGEPVFYPNEGGMVEPSAPQSTARQDGALFIGLTPGIDYQIDPPENLDGLLVLEMDGQEIGVEITAPRAVGPIITTEQKRALAAGAPARRAADSMEGTPPMALLMIFGFAILGGVILNAMPCVFPIVFLKASSVAKLGGADRATIRMDAFAYTAGVLVTFAAMAALLLALRAGGATLGWGFHLQSPIAVGFFAVVVFLIGLNLAGLFEIGTSLQGAGGELSQKKGPAGSFFTGLLAVLVAAPCIGPLLGLPIGYALAAPPAAAIAVFLALGLGLALPYLLLAVFPQLAQALPKPGMWMVRLKQLFSFAMFGTVVWLAWVVSLQAGPQGVLYLGIAFVAAAVAAWLFGLSQEKGGALPLKVAAILAFVIAFAPLTQLTTSASATAVAVNKEAYDEARLARLQAEGTPVFIDFTAAWCVTCQYNKRVVLDTPEMKQLFAETGTIFMVADLTNPDPVITNAIERQGRSGVPLYLYYNGMGDPEILPQILTADRMRETLERS